MDKNEKFFNIMIVGVGGQGIMTMAKFLREYSLHTDSIQNMISMESRGVSQREGSVYALVRYIIKNNSEDNTIVNSLVLSPVPPLQNIHLMLALEPLELLRNIQYIHPKALVILNTQKSIPKSSINSETKKYPDIGNGLEKLKNIYPKLKIIIKNYSKQAVNEKGKSIYANYLILEEVAIDHFGIIDEKLYLSLLNEFFNF